MNIETKVSHTPGPWTFENMGINHHGVQLFQIDQHEDAPVGDENHVVCLAEVYGDEANAKLIAAAPQLLKALQMLDECLSDGIPLEKNDPCHRRIKEEIQKATL